MSHHQAFFTGSRFVKIKPPSCSSLHSGKKYSSKKALQSSPLHSSKSSKHTLLAATAVVAILALNACKKDNYKANNVQANADEITDIHAYLAEKTTDKDKVLVNKGMKAVLDGDLQTASKTFSMLLVDSPLDAHLHTLNALTYQLMAEKGEITKLELAQAGYEQALKIDPHINIAALQLGRIFAKKKDYVKAQEHFSDVLLRDAHNAEASYELASVSYHMGDLKTACMAIDRALVCDGKKPEYVRAGAMIYAALGNEEQAQLYNARYSTLKVSNRHKKSLEQRVDDWLHLHKNGLYLAQADEGGGSSTESAVGDISGTQSAAGDLESSDSGEGASGGTGESSSGESGAESTAEPVVKKTTKRQVPRQKQIIYKQKDEDMVVVDAVIMRVTEIATTQKGNNILDNMQMLLAPGNFFKARGIEPGGGFTGASINLGENISADAPAGALANNNSATLITQGLSFGLINYSLKIANARDQYAEIIGRPTLTAATGTKAKFMSGRTRKIAVNGQFGGNITSTPIGTSLEIKSVKYEKGFITLEIEIIASSFEQGDDLRSNISNVRDGGDIFTINEDRITTTVKLRAGESVILGGITQRELKTSKDGVPFLQSIPIIQYFFSQERSDSDRKSIMFVLTPRAYKETRKETKRYFARGQEFGDRPKLSLLERRHKDWYDPSINNNLILEHLEPVYDEFRTGDLHSIKWGHDEQVGEQMKAIANFLYY